MYVFFFIKSALLCGYKSPGSSGDARRRECDAVRGDAVRDDAVRDAIARARCVVGGGDPDRVGNQGRGQCSPSEQGKKMARVGSAVCGVPAVFPLLFVAMAMAASDLFDNQLGDISYCKNQCQITIKNKKAAKVSDLYRLHKLHHVTIIEI